MYIPTVSHELKDDLFFIEMINNDLRQSIKDKYANFYGL